MDKATGEKPPEQAQLARMNTSEIFKLTTSQA